MNIGSILAALVAIVILVLVFAGIGERYGWWEPVGRPPSGVYGQPGPAPGPIRPQFPSPLPPDTPPLPKGMHWQATVDCRAMNGSVVINPSTGRPSCFVPNQ